jgi:hypothetical protein
MRFLLSLVLVISAAVACSGERSDRVVSHGCTCSPREPFATVVQIHGQPVERDPRSSLLQELRSRGLNRYQLDDGIRRLTALLCSPCDSWVHDTDSIEEMFPLEGLEDAHYAGCLRLVMKDGSILYGRTRPTECRSEH